MGPQEIMAALNLDAENEKRAALCVNGAAHEYLTFRGFGSRVRWSECFYCGVTESYSDYALRLGALQ